MWCQWVSTDDGAALEWDGTEKFYRSSGWMEYLIGTFLATGATLQKELRKRVQGRTYPDEFEQFTFNHVLNGVIEARGQDGARWHIEVVDNVVGVREIEGKHPTEYVVFVMNRHEHHDLDREFDDRFDPGFHGGTGRSIQLVGGVMTDPATVSVCAVRSRT